MLTVDYTLIIQIADFLILLAILNLILYKPIRKILNQRAERMTGFEKMIEEFLANFDRSSKDLQENMVNARREGFAGKEEMKKQGFDEEKELVEGAMTATGDKISEAKKRIEGDILSARQSLESEMSGFTKELAEKILGRSL